MVAVMRKKESPKSATRVKSPPTVTVRVSAELCHRLNELATARRVSLPLLLEELLVERVRDELRDSLEKRLNDLK